MVGVFFLVLPVLYALVYSGAMTMRTGDCGPKVGVLATLRPSFDPRALENLIAAWRTFEPNSDEGCSDEWSAYLAAQGFSGPGVASSGGGSWFPRSEGSSQNPGVEPKTGTGGGAK